MQRRIAIVGAGPIGLEAALFAVQAGYDVQVFERGTVAANVLDWGHVRLFSPFKLNASPWGRAALIAAGAGEVLPADNAVLTGREFAASYLRPLSQLPALSRRIHENTAVCAIGRRQTWKGDLVGNPLRAEDPFNLLVRKLATKNAAELSQTDCSKPAESVTSQALGSRDQECGTSAESQLVADLVLDCSGTYPNHNWVGAGGIPCVGEASLLSEDEYKLPDILGTARPSFLGKRTTVIGSGFSAATAVVSLAQLAQSDPTTRIVWLTRERRTAPLSVIENDPLPERARLIQTANRLALESDGPVQWLADRLIQSIDRGRHGYVLGTSQVGQPAQESTERIASDRLIANVGYRPDRRLYEELQIHECYATGGPIALAAALLGETSTDCLSTSVPGPDTLRNPEPGFFILGSKSYGRDSRFLIQAGLEQIRTVFELQFA